MEYYCEEDFENKDFRDKKLTKGEYEACRFINCSFQDQHLSGYLFTECEFIDCDFSNMRWKGSKIQDAYFSACKMLGLRFEELSDFNLSFQAVDCRLDHSSFINTNLSHCSFKDCSLKETDFTEANLSKVTLLNCDFQNARFEHCNLNASIWSDSYNIHLDPRINQLKDARIPKSQLIGILAVFGIKVED